MCVRERDRERERERSRDLDGRDLARAVRKPYTTAARVGVSLTLDKSGLTVTENSDATGTAV